MLCKCHGNSCVKELKGVFEVMFPNFSTIDLGSEGEEVAHVWQSWSREEDFWILLPLLLSGAQS